jgi:hypothetical protein
VTLDLRSGVAVGRSGAVFDRDGRFSLPIYDVRRRIDQISAHDAIDCAWRVAGAVCLDRFFAHDDVAPSIL